ncbi:MAG: flagellar basal body P-ring protein FlgI [Gammaproteobacteria bacterium]|nr:flagellar basal body P-ring protein FlgI [Gammaproteobacteria bacterium]
MKKLILFILICTFCLPCMAERIKDLVAIQGIRSNQLVGYGLVVGLDGTGDTEAFTKQSFRSMLNNLGVTIPANIVPNIKNVAAVALHADLPAFAKPGQRIDITVSSLGNAKSLRGGSLLLAPLKGADGNVYAVAQGDLIVGGLSAEGADGSKITVNLPVVGRIPNGAIVERGVPTPFSQSDMMILNLHRSDFTTARRMAEAINTAIGPGVASTIDSTSVKVHMPLNVNDKVTLVSAIENIEFTPGENRARIVVNSRTGTIVIGKHVTVGPAAIAHGNLIVTVTEREQVSQPQPLSNGVTTITPKSDVSVSQTEGRMFLLKAVSLEAIVNAVNKVGTAPGDLMAILEALKQAGALNADLEII